MGRLIVKTGHKSKPYTNVKITAKPGTYAIIFFSRDEKSVQIGRLGTLKLRKGSYIYIGSAFGTGGLKGRISRHLLGRKSRHWHVDHLRTVVTPYEVWYTTDSAVREHAWARVIAQWQGASIPLKGFGSSDCRCDSHLYFFDKAPEMRSFERKIRIHFVHHDTISVYKVTQGNSSRGGPDLL